MQVGQCSLWYLASLQSVLAEVELRLLLLHARLNSTPGKVRANFSSDFNQHSGRFGKAFKDLINMAVLVHR